MSITMNISGAILFSLALKGSIIELLNNHFFVIGGIILIVGTMVSIQIIKKFRYNQRINRIIENYKGSQEAQSKIPKFKVDVKGWGMNNSPFRERKSGVTWGGGNIHGANASREKRKSFLK